MARLYWEFLLLIYGEEEQNLLNNLVGELLHRTPQAGRHMVQGALRSRGLRIQRERFRDAIIRGTFENVTNCEACSENKVQCALPKCCGMRNGSSKLI